MQTDLADLLFLFHALGPAPRKLARLLDHFAHDPARIRRASTDELAAAGIGHADRAKLRAGVDPRVERDLEWAAADDNHLVRYDDPAYPELLRQIGDFPLLLYASGDLGLLRHPQIAIVGSRLCTPGGARIAGEFAGELARAGLVVTSGLALGIDAAAHRGALGAGGKTIAVTATGRDIVYPWRNRRLAGEIAAQGLIVSEFGLGTPARAAHFPQRNRIISGLSLATVVIEAASRSGSLITARLAAEQGREVFAVPGSIHNPQTRGCHRLLRDGAVLAETPRDIVAELAPLLEFVAAPAAAATTKCASQLPLEQRRLLDAIGYDPVTADTLAQRSGLTIDRVSSMLQLLEINDFIQSAPGGCFVRI